MFQGYVDFHGQQRMIIKDLFWDLKNDFTYEFWVSPIQEHKLTRETFDGVSGIEGQRYIIGAGHPGTDTEAGTGVSVGTNGVSVFEHSNNHLPAMLACKVAIKNWTHIAIVYRDKTPYLYVNGNYIKKGRRSSKQNVYASGQFGGFSPYGYFEGKANHIRIWSYPRTHLQVRSHMDKQLTGDEQGLVINLNYQQPTSVQMAIEEYKEIQQQRFLDQTILNQYCLEAFNETNYIKHSDALFKGIQADVILPIYNNYELTTKCLETVFNNCEDVDYNLWIINDASPDKRIYSFLEDLKSKPAPKNLKKLTIIHNDVNVGYVQNINKGLRLSKNHPIILNSDTEIPPKSFQRLIQPILVNDHISSVTPFSNSATICSFPNFLEDNELPYHMTVNEVDAYFSKYNINKGVVIPTGVGFCMALNRNVINKIGVFDDKAFGKGYGEENDWCMRARTLGYKNILIPNLFVYHKHGGSFGQINNMKQELMENNLKILLKRYPNYNEIIQDFTAFDPIKNIRNFIKSVMVNQQSPLKKGTLFINHAMGGGAIHFQSNYINKVKNEQRIFTLKPNNHELILTDHNHQIPITHKLSISKLNDTNFRQLLNALHIDLIFINHLLGYPTDKMFSWIKHAGIDYYFFVHDFHCLCPSFNLINHNKQYCNAETDPNVCQSCLEKLFPREQINIKSRRLAFESFLKSAKKVIAPSENTKNILLKYYRDIKVEVHEHTIDVQITRTYKENFLKNKHLNIAFVGAIGPEKGSNIIYELKDFIAKEHLPINIKVIGFTDRHGKPYKSNDGKFEVTGSYKVEHLSQLLADHQIALVVNSSICPETYSYTTSEVMLAGYPIITFNLGAPADRIKKHQCGWIVDKATSLDLLILLKRLNEHREEINEKAEKLRNLS
ncbi:glycosyltransferase [Heyndrickxia ginsengihumi]|uniref:glycosyltransferase n=1 Tax=Heyndrickxia ginsengihumi TaxID=363870 RepID=UPI003D1EF87E